MTGAEAETTAPDALDPTEEFQRLGKQLLRTAKNSRAQAAIQALVEERTILDVPAVRHALIVDTSRGAQANFDGLLGRQYALGLDEQQRSFLGLVLSMVGIGMTTIAAVQDLDERCLPIILRAILRLAGNDTIAVGTRL
ncbi:hypothetical protein ACFWMJ_00700 [Streptomyces hawaiiensis]|uniref:hypothetical protein n=1 Tax=Streptomyces hawaiiensis TaxID=67305 RepID=UPI0036564970